MKKLYTLLLAASVAASAVAAPAARINAKDLATVKTEKTACKLNLATNATVKSTALTKINNSESATSKQLKAPAKAAPTNMAELVGPYDYSVFDATAEGDELVTLDGRLSIIQGEGENEVVIDGFVYSDVAFKGTVDFAKGTITIKPQVLIEMPDDPRYPGASMNIYLLTYNENWTAEDRNANMTMTLNADGSITSDDLFVLGVEGIPGAMYDAFAYPELTPSDLNTTVYTAIYDSDPVTGKFLPTYKEVVSYCKAEYHTEYLVQFPDGQIEDLGEVVSLTDFLYSTNDYIVETYKLPIIIERDYGTTYLEPVDWFEYVDEEYEDDFVITPVTIVNNKYDGIEGTFSENTISWDVDWFSLAIDLKTNQVAGNFNKFKGCTLVLPFNVEDPDAGLKDVTVDNNSNAPVEFYNIQGMRINEPAAGQLVIRRQGNKVSKLIVK